MAGPLCLFAARLHPACYSYQASLHGFLSGVIARIFSQDSRPKNDWAHSRPGCVYPSLHGFLLLCWWCNHPALRCPPVGVTHLAGFHGHSVQPLSNRALDHPVAHPLVQKAPKVAPIDVVEKALNVEVDDPATAHLHQSPPQRIQRLVGTAPPPKPIRAIQKILLIHLFQHHQYRTLEHFILQRRNTDRARLLRLARLRDMYPSHRRRSIPTRNDVGSALLSLSRLDHAAYTLPVYASQPGPPPEHATLGSGWWPTFTGSGLAPAGSHERFPSWLSVYMTFPLTKLCLAQ
jgi:hypothetical protein